MPITPSKLKRLTKPLTFTFVGEQVNIAYYPAAFGSQALDEWNAVAAQANAATDEAGERAAALAFGELICRILAAWDYCEDPDPETPDGPPGPPIPLTPERILAEFQRYPLFFPEFLKAIIEAIAADVNRGNATGTPPSANSAATSSPTETSDSMMASRNSSASSSSPAGSEAGGQLSNGC